MTIKALMSEKEKIAERLKYDIDKLETIYAMRKLYEKVYHIPVHTVTKFSLFQNMLQMLKFKIMKREYPIKLIKEYPDLQNFLNRIKYLQSYLFANFHEFNVETLIQKEFNLYRENLSHINKNTSLSVATDDDDFITEMPKKMHEILHRANNNYHNHFQETLSLLGGKKQDLLEDNSNNNDDNDDILERIRKIRESLGIKKKDGHDKDLETGLEEKKDK